MSNRYNYCIVPKCTNTTFTTPEKVFFDVPRNIADRKRWCRAMNRDDKQNPAFSEKSVRHVCEDHFDIETDTENYMRWKLQGGNLRVKNGVLPHVFACQKSQKVAASTERAAKRQRLNTVRELLQSHDQPSTSSAVQPSTSLVDVTIPDVEINKVYDKTTQASLKIPFRSKFTSTSQMSTKEVGCNTVVATRDAASSSSPKTGRKAISTINPSELDDSESSCSIDEDSDYQCIEVSGSDYDPEENDDEAKQQMRACMLHAVSKNTLMCLGIPQQINFLVEFLSEKAKCPAINVMITLKKIRMHESYACLAMLFGMSISNIARIFHTTLYRLASVLQNFIIWSNVETIQRCLPIAFRARYGRTQSIIDCFEVQIEKPSDSQHQSLTWSDYKKANTLKYLVSCTPGGTVSFVSKGYGGRTTDTAILEDSDYLDQLFPNLEVMADRGFKNISHLIEARSCKLVRPPSVSADQPMTAGEVKSSRQIAALKIHVERLINRIRNFHMCLPHACIDHSHVQIFDQVVIVVCGLINLQSNLIKT